MARKPRSNAISEHVRIVQGALAKITPPAHVPLDDGDLPFWDSVIAEFARADWSAHQLELAAMLARDMADVARIQMQLRAEKDTIVQPSGNVVANPLMANLRMKTTNIMAMRRSLALHARARDGDNRDAGSKKRAAKAVQSSVVEMDDDFIPRATH